MQLPSANHLRAALAVLRSHARAARRRVASIATTGRARIETFIGDKIRRRVQPPIVVALVTSAAALAVAIAAFLR